MTNNPIYVARPIVPSVDDFLDYLRPTLEHRRLSNGGPNCHDLQLRLSELLRTRYVNLVCNGTIAIEIAAKALNFQKRIITTPFTFAATVSALIWIGLDPVLVDIDEDYLTIDVNAVKEALHDDVGGILGVHVYGCPCDVDALDELAQAAKIPIVYDGAHVFDSTYKGRPVVSYGDATTMSFHATKQFNTGEGGAIVTNSHELDARISLLKNFGIASEDLISQVGINGKMSELSAAFGLANLNALFEERARRNEVAAIYTEHLAGHSKIRPIPLRPGTLGSPSYYAVRLPVANGMPLRDRAYLKLRELGIFTRKYFYPLLCDVPSYRIQLSQKEFQLPNARRAAQEVLTLPLHGGVTNEAAIYIAELLKASLDD